MVRGKLFGIIVGDSVSDQVRTTISRANGAHRIATLLRKREVEVEVIDFFNDWTIDELKKFISNFQQIDFLGLSIGLGVLNDQKVNLFIDLIKSMFPDIKIIAGGSLVTTANFKHVNYYFRGFADGAIDEIFNYISNNRLNPFVVEEIKTHDVKKVIDCNKHYSNFDLANLKTEYTPNDFILPNETLTLETSRGCVFKCKFCTFPLTGKNKNDYIRDKEDIKNELIENYQKYKVTNYIITDDTFNDNRLKVDMLFDISKELPFKLNYVCYTRIDLLHMHAGTFEKMIESGVRAMFFGIESLTPKVSKNMRKLFTGEKLQKFLLEIKSKYPDLHLTGSFIVGLPDESILDIKDNIKWAAENKIFDATITFPLYIPIDNQVNYLSPMSYEWDQHGYEKMSIEEIQHFLKTNEDFFKNTYYNSADFEKLGKHAILWKNKEMNFLQAEMYASQIRSELQHVTTISAFGCFGSSFSSIPLEVLLKTPRDKLDWNIIKNEARSFIDNYKTKKLKIKYY